MSAIKDINLAPSGAHKIDWVRKNCPLLRSLEDDFSKERPFEGIRIALSIHLEAKTAYLCKVLAAGGAEMYITGSNPLSTQDDVAAALVADGLNVYAWYDCTPEEYDQHITSVLENNCNIIIDDGGDLVHMLRKPQVIGTGGDAAGIKRQFPDTGIYVASLGNKIQIDFLADAVGTWFSVIHQKFGRSGGKAIGAKPLLKWSDDGAVWMPQSDFDFVRVGFPELKV